MWCSLQVLTQIRTHIRLHIILDSQCLIFRVVIADDTRRTLERRRRKIEEGNGGEMVKVKGSSGDTVEK